MNCKPNIVNWAVLYNIRMGKPTTKWENKNVTENMRENIKPECVSTAEEFWGWLVEILFHFFFCFWY